MEIKVYDNGFLVTALPRRYFDIQYHGIENDPFPVDQEVVKSFFSDDQMEQFETTIYYPNGEIALLPASLAKSYSICCSVHKKESQLLYIEACRDHPRYDLTLRNHYAKQSLFLGYDVGQCSFDYYSSVLSDLILRRELFSKDHFKKLNQYGLFTKFEDAKVYLTDRTSIKSKSADMVFEEGFFHILAVYRASFEND